MGTAESTVHYFERQREFYISGKENAFYAVIRIPIGPVDFRVSGDRVEVSGDRTGILWNDRAIGDGAFAVQNGDVILAADYCITFFRDRIELDGILENATIRLPEMEAPARLFEGYPYYKRSPRVIYTVPEKKVEIKAPPARKQFSRGGLLAAVLPSAAMLLFTILMGFVLKRGAFIYMSAGMTGITMIFSVRNFLDQRKEIRNFNAKRDAVYHDYLLEKRKNIRKERAKEREALDYRAPDGSALIEMLQHGSSRLYERTITDDDFLCVNLGYYKGKSAVTVKYDKEDITVEKDPLAEEAREIPKEYGEIDRLPLEVDLKKAHLGLVGSRKNIHEELKYLMLQMTFFQSYRDLQIILIHSASYRKDFHYMRWYPHLKIQAINITGEIDGAQARDQILGSLNQILKDRKQKIAEKSQETVFTPYFLFLIDEPKLILNHAIMEYLQGSSQNLGFSIIYCTDQVSNLPENIHTVCILENREDGRLLLDAGERKNRSFLLPHVSGLPLEESARMLAGIIHQQGVSSKIPESVTFFDMYQIEKPEELHTEKRWKQNHAYRSLAVPLGLRAEDDIVELNLHEKAHGPHGLVAGTTGSGKSEIIQSYILSLALNFSPLEVGFLLIDYKGGGMANLFQNLPHLLGTITNLDKAESTRAMASIKSELARRERIFSEAKVNNINGYNKKFLNGDVAEPLPHLFIISDEFAELKKEQPEFMSELVSTARVGRSLGMHLILATQKPSGVVDDQIWSNSHFHLCLKVQNEGDSREMLRTPDAANITQAGRAYLQVGSNEIYELFQSAWSGAVYQGGQTEEEKEDDRVWMVNSLGQGELLNQDLSSPLDSTETKATQLDVLVAYLHNLYEENRPAVEPRKPWLPSLPEELVSPYTQEIRDSAGFLEADYTLGLGMVDIPEEQKQEEYALDLLKNGNLLYMASSGFGKSVLLTDIVMGLSMKNSVRNLIFYILDWGNSALIPLKALPHVADYIGMDDEEKNTKFRKIILDEISERKRKFAKAMAQNFSVYRQMQADRLPAIGIVIDNYDGIKDLGEDMEQFVQRVARDGAGLGIYLIATITRENAMRGSVLNTFKERIAGYNFNPSENRALVGKSEFALEETKKGRALVRLNNVNVMQLYTPVSCRSDVQYIEDLQNLVGRIAAASSEEPAEHIPVLPEDLYFSQLHEYPGYSGEPDRIPVGIETEQLHVVYLNLTGHMGIIIGGAQTGKTNVIHNVLRRLAGRKIWLFDNAAQTSVGFRNQENLEYAVGLEQISGALEEIGRLIEERKEEFEEAQIDDVSLIRSRFLDKAEKVYLVIDGAQELETLFSEARKGKLLDRIAEAASWGVDVISASDQKLPFSGSRYMDSLKQIKAGIVLGNIKEQRIYDVPRIREENHNPKFGYLVDNGTVQKLMIACSEEPGEV